MPLCRDEKHKALIKAVRGDLEMALEGHIGLKGNQRKNKEEEVAIRYLRRISNTEDKFPFI